MPSFRIGTGGSPLPIGSHIMNKERYPDPKAMIDELHKAKYACHDIDLGRFFWQRGQKGFRCP